MPMQPRPHDTQRLPAHDRPENQYPATEQLPPVQDQRGSGGRRTGTLIAIGAAVVVVLLLVAAVGLELGLRKSIGDRLKDEASLSLGSPAEVDLGARPVLLSYATGELGSVHITTDGTPVDGASGPVPAIDITAEGVREDGDLTRIASLQGTAFVSDRTMTEAATDDTEAGDGMLGGLVQVQDIVSDPESGNLRVSISGLAEAVVTPRLTDGQLEMAPEEATVFGFELPPALLGGTISMMDSTLADLPDGVELTGVRVVPGGMTVDLAGTDVELESSG